MQRDKIYYQAYKMKDPEFDGIFFVGVISTGIYCRPVCTAKMPKQKNCLFFPTITAAQNKEFRPCRRCRPDLTPGFSNVDIALHLARSARNLIEKGVLNDHNVEYLCERLGITSRHLRRIFVAKFGITPIKFAHLHRLSLAEQLLKSKNSTITEIALKSGFNSVRQFNEVFKKYYNMNPTQFCCGLTSINSGSITLNKLKR